MPFIYCLKHAIESLEKCLLCMKDHYSDFNEETCENIPLMSTRFVDRTTSPVPPIIDEEVILYSSDSKKLEDFILVD